MATAPAALTLARWGVPSPQKNETMLVTLTPRTGEMTDAASFSDRDRQIGRGDGADRRLEDRLLPLPTGIRRGRSPRLARTLISIT